MKLLQRKCKDQKIEIIRREGGGLATTVKFSTNGLPKLRSGLLLKKKEGPPERSLQFSVTGLHL